jgi:opacity protein-like surface antigen
MKKTFFTLLLMGLILAPAARAVEIRLAFQAGPRSISDSEIKDVYGTGVCYFPSVSALLWKGIFAGAGFELAGKRDGTIGEYAEATTFKMTGFQAFVGYELALDRFKPYVLAGYGSFSYEQTVDSPAAQPVKETKGAIFFAGGVRIAIWKGLFLSAEAKYVPLKVQPYDVEVNLGGMRFLGGIGWSFGI